MAALDGVPEDGPEDLQGMVGAAGGAGAVTFEPSVDHARRDLAERRGAERGQKLASEVACIPLRPEGL